MDSYHPNLFFGGAEQKGQGIMAKSYPLDIIKCLFRWTEIWIVKRSSVSSRKKEEERIQLRKSSNIFFLPASRCTFFRESGTHQGGS